MKLNMKKGMKKNYDDGLYWYNIILILMKLNITKLL